MPSDQDIDNVLASQIQLGDLLPMLHIFGSSIKRLCMVGDHKQCMSLYENKRSVINLSLVAPYGQEQVQGIESIFEIDHIVNSKDSTTTLLSITWKLLLSRISALCSFHIQIGYPSLFAT
jgi:hypothetical protein